MITRKHLFFAIAATSLLTMFLITIVPSRGQNAGEYDPWLDWNDDGKINLIDIFRTELAFGTSGDPTKNVSVTNWPSDQPVFPSNLNLRGTYATEGVGHILVDDDTPYPNQDNFNFYENGRMDFDGFYVNVPVYPSTALVYNQTFVYEKVPTKSYKILGELQASILFNITYIAPSSIIDWTMSVNLYAISTSFVYRYLTTFGTIQYSTISDGSYWSAVSAEDLYPITVNPYERLAVIITMSAAARFSPPVNNLHFYFMYRMGTNDLLITIPTTQS